MKILMINHFPLTGSGSGTYTKNLAVHLNKLGHEICIILPENTKDFDMVNNIKLHPVYFANEEKIDGALDFNFPCFTSHPRSVTTFKDLNETQLNQYIEAFDKAIKEEIEDFKPDIIHGQHVWILPSLVSSYDISLVLTAHGTDLMGIEKWPEFKKYAKKAMDKCEYVISISKDNCELLKQCFPEHENKIVMMRNGYDPSVFFPETYEVKDVLEKYDIKKEEYLDKKIISFAGKLAHFKGIDVLLDAIKIYEAKDSNTITIIAGDGDEKENLLRQKETLGLKSVHFIGNVKQEELRKIYNIAFVNLVPSRREPFGLVAIEAMGCGAPVIATNEGGLPDFVNEEVGGLVPVEDHKELAKKILEVLNRYDGDEYLNWRKRIFTYARNNYAQDTIIKELEQLYRKCL